MVWEELAFDDTVTLHTAGKWIVAQLNAIVGTGIRTIDPRVIYPALYPSELSPHPQIPLQQWVHVNQLDMIWSEIY